LSGVSRRGLFGAASGLVAAAGLGIAPAPARAGTGGEPGGCEPFWGRHQAGIVTPP